MLPTVGWIREGDLDAFYEGTERFPDPIPMEPTFSCPFCSAVLASQAELHNHVYATHRVERPFITLGGTEPTKHHVVRSSLAPVEIALANASFANLSVDGASSQRVSLAEVKDVMAKTTQGEVSLELVNEVERNTTPVMSRYRFSFRVAEKIALQGVEKAFTQVLVTNAITRESIGNFLSDMRTQGSGREYAAGLADYCLGIILKERPEDEKLTTPMYRYRELYGGALEVLKDFRRPLANLIASIIRFSMNDFKGGGPRTGYWELDMATELLLDPNSASVPRPMGQSNRHPVCPVDHGTGRILELASYLVREPRWSPILDDECRGTTLSDFLDISDRQKAYAIWAVSAWRLGSKQNALEPLTQIAEVYPFSRWARKYLEQVST